MSELLLGIDVGTTNSKAVLATPDGRVVGHGQAQHSTYYQHPGWAEQSPEAWWAGVVAATRQALASAGAQPEYVRGIGVSGQGCAVTLLGRGGQVIRPAIIWMDSRSEAQCEQLRQTCADAILRVNGKQPAPYNADPTLMWLQQHEPQSIRSAQTSLTTTAYLTYRLTGEVVANVADASILFGFDLAAGKWSEELIDRFGLPRRLYPPVAECNTVIGQLTEAAAEALGLSRGIPVVAGGEDTPAAGLAIGAVSPGQALLSLGTAGTIYVVQDQIVVHPQLLTSLHMVPGHTLIGGSIVAFGAALTWVGELIDERLDATALMALAATSAPGANGVIFLPYLSGELQPINDGNARGVFVGITPRTGRAQMVRAVLEGVAFAISHNLQVIEAAGVAVDEIRAVGGPTQSPLWCQILADAADRPLIVLANDTGAPLGSALLAGAGVGLVADLASTSRNVAQVERTSTPHPPTVEHYRAQQAIYQQFYPQLRSSFAALARLHEQRCDERLGIQA